MALDKIPGKHIRCEYNVRGHFDVMLNGYNFSTRLFRALDFPTIYANDIKGRYLIDTESTDNEMIRNKMHLLPSKLQSLSLPINFSDTQKQLYIKNWISNILKY